VNNRRLMDSEFDALGIPTENAWMFPTWSTAAPKMEPENGMSTRSKLGLDQNQIMA
jgi:hypothetical protein